MRVRNLTFVAFMTAASAVMAQEANGYQFTDIVSNKAISKESGSNRNMLVFCNYIFYGVRVA